jgi:trypsin
MFKFFAMFLIALMPAMPMSVVRHKFNRVQENQHSAMHEIIMVDRDENGAVIEVELCAATAIGPHTLLTAEHCNEANSNAIYIDTDKDRVKAGTINSFTVLSRSFDHQDHMLIDVSGTYFPNYVSLNANVRTPKQGETYYFWGDPHGTIDMYREGYVMGAMLFPSDDKVDATGPLYLMNGPAIGGDSGASIYGQDGQLIGIVTFGLEDGAVIGVFPIQFNLYQIQNSLK